MKIFISVPQQTATWFWNMANLITNSLRDCGHQITDFTNSELVIVIQHLPSYVPKVNDKKYILLQTEQKDHPTVNLESYYGFGPNKIWGFGIDHPKEEYLCLGYHPCLEIPYNGPEDINVSFFGCGNPRRDNFFRTVRNKITGTATWNYTDKIRNIKRSKINLNVHSFCSTRYTEWDRICLILANKAFLLSEEFYCPLPITQFKSSINYDENVDYYLQHEKERKDITTNLYNLYKTKFDMRNILTSKLQGI